MIQQIEYLKHTSFFKNTSKLGGAMKYCINEKPSDNIAVVSRVLDRNKSDTDNFAKWGYLHPNDFLKLIKKDKHFYEIVCEYPHKVYFDIDNIVDKLFSEIEQEDYLDSLLLIIENTFKDAEFAVSGSYSDSKFSHHITLNNYLVHNEDEKKKLEQFCKFMKSTSNFCFDDSVYAANKQFKCVNQSKGGSDKRVQAVLMEDDLKKHIVTAFMDCPNMYSFPTFSPEINDFCDIEDSKTEFNMKTLPKMTIKTPDNIEWEKLNSLQILELLPISPQFDKKYIHKVARFCYSNNINFDKYLEWLRKGFSNIEKNDKGQVMWDKLENYPVCTIKQMMPILNFYYPDITKTEHFRLFKKMFDLPDNNNIEYTEIERFDNEEHIVSSDIAKISVIHLGMSNGKTTQCINYLTNVNNQTFKQIKDNESYGIFEKKRKLDTTDIEIDLLKKINKSENDCKKIERNNEQINKLMFRKNNKDYLNSEKIKHITLNEKKENFNKTKSFCWLGHRQSLHRGTYEQLKESGLNCHNYMNIKKDDTCDSINEANSISICVNSLIKLDKDKTYHTLIIDEIESLLEVFVGNFIDLNNKINILNKLVHLIKSATKVILLDAFISKKTYDFLYEIDKTFTISTIYKKVDLNRKIVFKNYKKDDKQEKTETLNNSTVKKEDKIDVKISAITEICDNLISGKRLVIFYPHATDIEQFAETISKKTNKKVIYYSAHVDDKTKKTLNNVNECWNNYDCVIYNSVITCGVSFNLKDYFDSCWLFIANFNSPRTIIQASNRVRDLISNTINVVYLTRLCNTETRFDDRKMMNSNIYNSIFKNCVIEDNAPKRKSFEIFCKKAGYSIEKSTDFIDSELTKEIDKIFEDSNCKIEYNDITEIKDDDEAEKIIQKKYSHDSTMMEKLMLSKYYFTMKFEEKLSNKTITKEDLSIIWDNKLQSFMTSLIKIQQSKEWENNVFKKIQAENNWETILPPDSFVKRNKKINMSNEVIDQIFNEYNFLRLSKTSNANIIFRNTFNTFTSYNAIISDYNRETKHTHYDINPILSKHRELIINLLI